MNLVRSLAIFAASLFALATTAAAATPAMDAYDNLTKAKTLLERSEVNQPKRNQRVVETQLTKALANLELVKSNRGTSLPLAKKAVEAAQAELAKGARAKALEHVDEALKQTQKAIDVKR